MKKLNENLKTLLQTFLALRNPKDGCPWDRVQTHESIAHCVIEEAYEVVDAIERNDFDSLKEELGDLLYQIIFHAEMANEKKAFNLSDVTSTLNKKLIRRHPHIFAEKKTVTSKESLMIWENIKAQEKPNRPQGSVMEEIPKKFPPFLKSKKLQKKAKKVGFDWDSVTQVLDKLDEEILRKSFLAASRCDVLICMGTSLMVSPANSIPKISRKSNSKVVILNKEATPFDDEADLVINGDLENIYEKIK
jgi:MazG family protein